jgi:hypothetical protein
MTDGLRGVGKEAVMAYFKINYYYLLEGSRTYRKPSNWR